MYHNTKYFQKRNNNKLSKFCDYKTEGAKNLKNTANFYIRNTNTIKNTIIPQKGRSILIFHRNIIAYILMRKTIFFLFLLILISLSAFSVYAESEITVSHKVAEHEDLKTGTHTFVLSENNEKIEKTIASNETFTLDIGPGSYVLTREPATYSDLIPDMSVYRITITENGTQIIKKDGVDGKQTKIEYVDEYKTNSIEPPITPPIPEKLETTEITKTSQNPKTGDNPDFIIWLSLLAISIGVLTYRTIKRRY